jgi:flagellar biosynthetic protein FliQ
MDENAVLDVALQAVLISAKLSAPFLLAALVIGFTVSLFQSVTQIQEATLSFVPKAIGVAVVLLVAGHWMISQMTDFVTELFARIPALLSGG